MIFVEHVPTEEHMLVVLTLGTPTPLLTCFLVYKVNKRDKRSVGGYPKRQVLAWFLFVQVSIKSKFWHRKRNFRCSKRSLISHTEALSYKKKRDWEKNLSTGTITRMTFFFHKHTSFKKILYKIIIKYSILTFCFHMQKCSKKWSQKKFG